MTMKRIAVEKMLGKSTTELSTSRKVEHELWSRAYRPTGFTRAIFLRLQASTFNV